MSQKYVEIWEASKSSRNVLNLGMYWQLKVYIWIFLIGFGCWDVLNTVIKNGWTIQNDVFWEDTIAKTVALSIPTLGIIDRNAVHDAETWDYKINGMPLWKEMRHIASALMPQAIISAEYIPYENPDGKVKGYMDIKTCHPDKLKMDTRHTLYLLNGSEITEKIFDAVNPVYIKSLKRIVDEQELKRFGRKKIKNVVEVETFSYEDLTAPQQASLKENDLLDVYLVNDIRLNKKSFDAINKTGFHKWYKFSRKDKRATPYLKKYPNAGSIEIGIIE